MKYLFALLVLLSCQTADEKIQPVYTDVAGSWTFKSTDISGSFNIAKASDGKYYVDSGDFTFTGFAKNSIGVKNEAQINGFKVASIILQESYDGDIIQFYYSGYVKSDYSEIKVKSYSFKNGTVSSNKVLTDSLTISRR